MSSIKDVISNFIDNRLSKEKYYSAAGVVDSVNESGKVCNITLVTGEKVEEVRIETDLKINAAGDVAQKDPTGFVLVPAVGSQVVVTFLNRSDAFVSMFSQIDKVFIKSNFCTFNTGDKGGLINIEDLESELNGLVNELTLELTKIQTAIIGVGGAYTPGSLTQFDKEDFEDETIKH
jgi:hypothetical protein